MKLADFAGLYKGERAFILGNGPSLAEAPFDKLKDEYTFAMNRISVIFDKTDWRPTFFVIVTTAFTDRTYKRRDFMRAVDESQASFVWDDFRGAFDTGKYKNVHFIHCSHFKDYPFDKVSDDWWSDEPTKRVCKWGTSTLSSLQLAAWMGFNPIYLLGVDGYWKKHKKSQPDKNHFDENYISSWSGDPIETNAAHKRALQIAKANAKRLGIEIYRDKKAAGYRVFPSIDLSEVLGDSDG